MVRVYRPSRSLIHWRGEQPPGPEDYLGWLTALHDSRTLSAEEVAGAVAEYLRPGHVAEGLASLPAPVRHVFVDLAREEESLAQLREWYPDKIEEILSHIGATNW